jgi:phosphoribosylglycinamide formyltransferase-1
LPQDTEATLAARVLDAEHRIYPQAVQCFIDGRLRIENGRVHIAEEIDPAITINMKESA